MLYSDSSPEVVFSLVTPDFLGQFFTRITSGAGKMIAAPTSLVAVWEQGAEIFLLSLHHPCPLHKW